MHSPAAPSLPPSQPLDAPLPVEIAGQGQGWFTGYRRFPVFSAPWARARTLAWIWPVGIVLLLIAGGGILGSEQGFPWAGVLGISLSFLMPLVIGPWLGVWVRRRGWPAMQEGWALGGAMAVLVVAMLLLEFYAAEPVKQTVAEWIGDVDETGKRRRVALTVGVQVRPLPGPAAQADSAAAGDAPAAVPPEREPSVRDPFNLAIRGVVAFWMGGGFALLAWRRQGLALAALARERELVQAQAARREAEMRLSVLAAQVEPHFLFNTLAGVRSAIATDPGRASAMIDRLVEYLRAAIPRLRSDGEVDATVGGQFELVRAYLGLMSARMPRLAFAIDAPADLLSARCPPLMLISLVENAVKHGVEPKIGPARIEVAARRGEDGRLVVTVADDGVGFGSDTAGTGIGLANIRERLAQLYPGRAALALQSRPQGGVIATLSLPLEQPGVPSGAAGTDGANGG